MDQDQRRPDGANPAAVIKHGNVWYVAGVAMPPSLERWLSIVKDLGPLNEVSGVSSLVFELGFPNEYWEPELAGLVVPVEGVNVLVVRHIASKVTSKGNSPSGYRIYRNEQQIDCENLLMTAALVRGYIDEYMAAQESVGVVASTGNT